jgi:hypothetical protein
MHTKVKLHSGWKAIVQKGVRVYGWCRNVGGGGESSATGAWFTYSNVFHDKC